MITKLIIFLLITISVAISQAQDSSNVSQLSFFEKGNINGYIFYQCGRVLDFNKNNSGNLDYESPVYRFRNSMGLNLGIHLFEYVFFRGTFYYQLNKNINSPWLNTDYTYSLERTKWEYQSFSYGYVNYQVNKYEEITHSFWESLMKGSFYVRYFDHINENIFKKAGVQMPFKFNYFITAYYAPHYVDNEGNIHGNNSIGKPMLSINGRYIFFKNLYLEAALNYYPIRKTKMNTDADFTYGFGYNKYTRFTIGMMYGNYSVSRFPWSKKTVKGYGFLDGNFTMLLNYKW